MPTNKQSLSKQIRWAILGPGTIAHTFAHAMQTVSSGTIEMVHSSSADRAKEFAAQYGIAQHTTELKTVLENQAIDAVYIAYPHAMHHQAMIQCLTHGKHVLCEKPLTISTQQAKDVIAIAQTNNLLLMEAMWTRFLPAWAQVRDWINNGHIGAVETIASSFGFTSPFDPDNRLYNPVLGGGALWDIGIYPISMSNYVTSEFPDDLEAELIRGRTGVDEVAKVTMHYPGGVTSRFEVSLREELSNHFIIEGELGTIRIASPFWGADRATINSSSLQETIHSPHQPNGFEHQINHVAQLINSNTIQSPVIPWADTLESQRIIEVLLTH